MAGRAGVGCMFIDAIPAIMANNQGRVEGSAAYKSAVARKDGELWLIAVDPATKKVLATQSRSGQRSRLVQKLTTGNLHGVEKEV